MAGETVLAIAAHPDDLPVFCGGTLAKLSQQGYDLVAVVASRGEKSTFDPAANAERLGRTRAEETRRSLRLLGVSTVLQLDYSDGFLHEAPYLRRDLVRIMRRYNPQAVFTFDPWKLYDTHPDHRELGFAALDARQYSNRPLFFPEMLAEGLSTADVPEIYLYNTDNANIWFDITGTFTTKIASVREHKSQFMGRPGVEMERALTDEARMWGPRAGSEFAEGFRHLVFGQTSLYSSLRGAAPPGEWV